MWLFYRICGCIFPLFHKIMDRVPDTSNAWNNTALIYATCFGHFCPCFGGSIPKCVQWRWPIVAKYGEVINRYIMTYFLYSFCVLIVSFKKPVAIPSVRHLVACPFIVDAQVLYQPSPMSLVVYQVALGQDFLRALMLYHNSIISPVTYTHISLMCHQCCTTEQLPASVN